MQQFWKPCYPEEISLWMVLQNASWHEATWWGFHKKKEKHKETLVQVEIKMWIRILWKKKDTSLEGWLACLLHECHNCWCVQIRHAAMSWLIQCCRLSHAMEVLLFQSASLLLTSNGAASLAPNRPSTSQSPSSSHKEWSRSWSLWIGSSVPFQWNLWISQFLQNSTFCPSCMLWTKLH